MGFGNSNQKSEKSKGYNPIATTLDDKNMLNPHNTISISNSQVKAKYNWRQENIQIMGLEKSNQKQPKQEGYTTNQSPTLEQPHTNLMDSLPNLITIKEKNYDQQRQNISIMGYRTHLKNDLK
jgi:hypothetical protein